MCIRDSDVHRGVDRAPARVGRPVLRGVRGHDRQASVRILSAEEVLVEQGRLYEGVDEIAVRNPRRDLGVLQERLQQPVRPGGPQMQRIGALEVPGVPRGAVRVGRRDDAPGPEERPGVLLPVGQLSLDQSRVRLGDLGEGGRGGGGDLEVQIGVRGEGSGPRGVPVSRPQTGQPGRQHPRGGEQVVAARREEPLQQRGGRRVTQQLAA